MMAEGFTWGEDRPRRVALTDDHISQLAKLDNPTLADAAAQDLKVLGRFAKKHKRYQNGGRLPW